MIYTLQGLRALAMLGIFLFHSGILLNGTFPVTFFFILSGFVTYYSKYINVDEMNIKECINWIINKMKPLYIVHILTFLLSIIIRWDWVSKLSPLQLIKRVILSLLLIQSFFKNDTFIFNGLSWFLSVIFILYILAIPCIKIVKNISKNKLTNMVVLILIIQYILNSINIIGITELNIYSLPIYRLLDFVLGMIVAKIFLEKKYIIKRHNLCETMILIIFIGMYILSFSIKTGCSYYSLLFIIALYVFSQGKGWISKILEIYILQKIASISFEFYMIHELILIVFRKVFYYLNYYWLINNIIISIPAFIISMVLAVFINKYITIGIKTSTKKSIKIITEK